MAFHLLLMLVADKHRLLNAFGCLSQSANRERRVETFLSDRRFSNSARAALDLPVSFRCPLSSAKHPNMTNEWRVQVPTCTVQCFKQIHPWRAGTLVRRMGKGRSMYNTKSRSYSTSELCGRQCERPRIETLRPWNSGFSLLRASESDAASVLVWAM